MCESNSALICRLSLTVELAVNLTKVHFELRHCKRLLRVGCVRDIWMHGLTLCVADLRLSKVGRLKASLHLRLEMSVLYVIHLTCVHGGVHHIITHVVFWWDKSAAVYGTVCRVGRREIRARVYFLHFWCKVLLYQTTRHEDLTICRKGFKGGHMLKSASCRSLGLINQNDFFY